jgi:hypothetical protein
MARHACRLPVMTARLMFDKFEVLKPGDACYGADVKLDGKRIGCIERKIEYRDIGTVSARYASKIVGYMSTVYDGETTEHQTLAQARAVFRAIQKGSS